MPNDVMSYDFIIPVPPGFNYRGRPVLGLMRCLRGCGHFQLVRTDKNGFAYSACDNVVSVHSCACRQLNWGRVELPEPTLERVRLNPDFQLLSPAYLQWLADAWGVSVEELKGESIEQRPSGTPEPVHIPDTAGNSGSAPGNSDASDTGELGNPGEQPGNLGPSSEPERDTDGGFLGLISFG